MPGVMHANDYSGNSAREIASVPRWSEMADSDARIAPLHGSRNGGSPSGMTEHVFRPKRRVKGKLRVARTYSGHYRLAGDAHVITVALRVSDKQVAEEKLRKIVVEAE